MLTITSGPRTIPHKVFVFPGGEVSVKLTEAKNMKLSDGADLTIRASLRSSNDIMELMLVVNAIRCYLHSDASIKLVCPYLPYARQDRVCDVGEALSIKVMCDLINSLNFTQVEVWDVHSDVSLALLNNVVHKTQWDLTRHNRLTMGIELSNTILVAPDAGAVKKTMVLAKGFEMGMITAEKIRNPKTGEITGTKVHSEALLLEKDWIDGFGKTNFLIVDDICDGGRTFISLAEELKKITTGKIFLYVTHGIFSKGLGVFEGLIDKIFTANCWPGVQDENQYEQNSVPLRII